MPQNTVTQNSLDDETLMARVRDKDCESTFGQLFQRWSQPIRRLCYRMTGNWEDAEDLTQDVFSSLFKYRKRYQVRSRFSTYLWKIALNRCRDFSRQKKRRGSHHQRLLQLEQEKSLLRDQQPEREALSGTIRDAVMKLNPRHREVLILRHFENLKFEQIAEILDIPTGTVASRMAKALNVLGQLLRRQGVIRKKDEPKPARNNEAENESDP